jgi:hypothetical protein
MLMMAQFMLWKHLVNGVATVLVSVLVTRNVVGLLPWECVGDH